MLKDRPIAIVAIAVVLLGVLFSASLLYCESSNTDCENLRRQSYTRAPEFALSPILLGDSGAAKKEASPAAEPPPPCPAACKAVFRTYDDPLALLTALLVLILVVQLAWMVRQEKALRGANGADESDASDEFAPLVPRSPRSAVAAPAVAPDTATPNADAAVIGQMPVLSPHVTDTAKLHPLAIDQGAERISFQATVSFTFENLGKTPAIIREVHADLFLTDRETLPPVDFDKLHRHAQTFVIPGDARGSSGGSKSVIEHQQAFSLRRGEFEELLSDARGAYRRFALVGKVTYDDLFGWRHSRTFCVKLRIWGQPPAIRSFQSQEGGLPYNRFRRERLPESERT